MVATDTNQETALEITGTNFNLALGDDPNLAHQAVVALKTNIGANNLFLGLTLYNIDKRGHYKELSHDSFESYLADPEVTIPRREAFRKMKTAMAFLPSVDEDGHPVITPDDAAHIQYLATIDPSKLDIIAPAVSKVGSQDEVDEWLSKAETLTAADLRKEIKRTFGKPDPPVKEWLQDLGFRIANMASKLHRASDPKLVLAEIVTLIEKSVGEIDAGKLPGAGTAPNRPMPESKKFKGKTPTPITGAKSKEQQAGKGKRPSKKTPVAESENGVAVLEGQAELIAEPVQE